MRLVKTLRARDEPATMTAQAQSRIVHATQHAKLVDATHWSTRTLAEHLGVVATTIRRVWRSNGFGRCQRSCRMD